MDIHNALKIDERSSLKNKNIKMNDSFENRIHYWRQFFYGNIDYMERSLKTISNLKLEDLPALEHLEYKESTDKEPQWYYDWKLILNGHLYDLPYSPLNGNRQFMTFINHFLRLAYGKLKPLQGRISYVSWNKKLYEDLFSSLASELFQMCHKVLILKLNELRQSSNLIGKSSKERYTYFERYLLSDQEFLQSLGKEYSVLVRSMIRRVTYWCSFVDGLLDNLERDWEILQRNFSDIVNAGKLNRVKLGMGDTHNKGKSVTIIEFESGFSLVYKPRNIEVDNQFQNLLNWVNKFNNDIPSLYQLHTVSISDHGWVEYVPYQTCETTEEVQNFYRRMGAQLSLLYVLNATDFHYENIIAMRDNPIFIDLESLFHQDIYEETYNEDALGQADKMLSASIMASGMLPNLLYQHNDIENTGIDLSGLGGHGNQKIPFKTTQINNAGTDKLHLRKVQTFLEEGRNLPSLKGELVNLHDYLNDIEDGFIKMYRFLESNKKDFIRLIQNFKDVKVRTVVRPTSRYGELLRSLAHPDLLRNGLDRDMFLHRVWLKSLGVPNFKRLLNYEKEDLHNGDVPIFTSKPGESHLWSSNEIKINCYFKSPAIHVVQDKVNKLGDKDLYEQLQVLHMVMLASSANHYADVEKIDPFHLDDSYKIEQAEFIQQAIDIGDYLLTTKIKGAQQKEKDVTWISTVLEGTKEVVWRISPVGLDLYNGNGGIALFLAYLSDLSGEERFKTAAEEAIIPILKDMKDFKNNPKWSLGAYSGVGGNIFTTFHLAQLWKDEKLLEQVKEALSGYKTMIKEDTIFDYIGGSAGALDIFINIYKNTGEHEALEGAILCGQHLMNNSKKMENGGIGWPSVHHKTALTGYSHGNAGIAASLSALYRYTHDETILPYISQALIYERYFYNEKNQNWQTPNSETTSFAWCHGAPGILLSRLRLKENGFKDEKLDQEIQIALNTTLAYGFGNNRSYCHGDFGQLEILLYADKLLKHVDLEPYIYSVRNQLLNLMKKKMWNYGVSRGTESKGLLTGLSGFGLGLLKQYNNEIIPNILSLE